MKNEFLARYDAATSLAAPGWEDSEISEFLNIAQHKVITELYKARRFDLISQLVKETTEITSATTPALVTDSLAKNLFTCTLSEINDYLYYVQSQSEYTRSAPTSVVAPQNQIVNEEIDLRQAAQFLTTVFNKPFFRQPKCFISNDKLKIIGDAYTTIIGLIITYVKTPTVIDITSETDTDVNEAIHKDIVESAVLVAIDSIKAAKISNQ